MCSNCYHSRGRDKKAWKCPHKDKIHYALGVCQNCYQTNYAKVLIEIILILFFSLQQIKKIDDFSDPDAMSFDFDCENDFKKNQGTN